MNQKGFIYPLTILIGFLICVIVLHQIAAYLTEKHFIYEQERMMQLESLLQVAITEFQKENYEPSVDEQHVYFYDTGTVTFRIRDYHDGLSNISVRAKLETGHERLAGFHYHWENKALEQYWEITNSTLSILQRNMYEYKI